MLFKGSKETGDFVHIEGIIGALRALEAGNVNALIKLFELLSGEKFDASGISEKELNRLLVNPKELAKVFVIHLRPMTELTDVLVLKNKLFANIRRSA